ncbi:c-type cytochrome [Leptospira noguchii]|uniref:Cytochrome C n=3 Tax=Leptospira noguchii TaxID=28182 RepID=M6Y120_9LEPT|nr:c-type cytochrome [Leptospira noguchii]EMO25765.1 cytochrome C [Leptospira interrogans serovar Bataviae str. HAI135]EKR72648.1 cytochrome C [Leptospira noguchii str. 2006001870]EMI60978.1 cytochrome C [Leptospira noguchii str. Bonito]EMM98676.1 cytochrome C [Leptospira noguchii str. 2007001578]EMO41804.1 cytochrome C [Leptospira noguchii serovar Autumnalis str. ZUN142]
MKKIHSSILILIFAILTFLNCSNQNNNSNSSRIERGKKLVMVAGCTDCHTAKIMTPQGPVPDASKFLAGYLETNQLPDYKNYKNSPWLLFTGDLTAVVGPWGVSFAKNITPDPETGIGGWTEDMFIQTVRTQKRLGVGRPILPPMNGVFIGNMNPLNDDELKDIFAYLKSLKPVRNRVPEPILN